MTKTDRLFVAGIGASAGGLRALQSFFSSISGKENIAYVVIQHLSPNFPSHMDDLLQRQTSLKISHVEDSMTVKAGEVYLMPPNKTMILSNGQLLLSDKEKGDKLSYPIDIFYRSLASDKGENAIAVILSGTGSDGTQGASDIYRAGGLVISQSPESAEFSAMPLSVRDAGFANYLLPPEQMPEVINKFARYEITATDLASAKDEQNYETDALDEIIGILQRDVGVDFSYYRRSTLDRRIARRAEQSCGGDINRYVELLRNDHNEANSLSNDFFIGVTQFFRDKGAFADLSENAIHELVSNPPEKREIRVWVCGCATGEEAYSIAMLFAEKMKELNSFPEIKIYATDIMKRSLEHASKGQYSEESLEHVSKENKEKYFVKIDSDLYRCKNELRRMIIFAPHNLLASAPFTRIDLICCRNLLIYFNSDAQKRVLQLFHFALREKAFLMLGKSETIGPMSSDFSAVSSSHQIYRKQRESQWHGQSSTPFKQFIFPPQSHRRDESRKLLSIYDEALREYMPPGIIVDEEQHLVHSFPGSEKFLQVKVGRASAHVLDMIDSSLRIHLARCLQQTFKAEANTSSNIISADIDGRQVKISINGKLLRPPNVEKNYALILFEEQPKHAPILQEPKSEQLDQPMLEHVADLEEELRYTRENLQTVVEELEASNEELQATNEELTASNEELQSSNEELHSVNEELHTVNEELNEKNISLSKAKADLENLLNNIDIGVIYLDTEMKIRRFTDNVRQLINLELSDIGRPIRSFNYAFTYRSFLSDIKKVIETGETLEKEVLDDSNEQHLIRILPYQRDESIEGVVIVILSIQAIKTAEQTIRQLSDAVEFSSDAIIAADLNGKVRAWNRGAESLYGFSHQEAIGRRMQDLIIEDLDASEFQKQLKEIAKGNEVGPIETQRTTKNGLTVDILKRMSPIWKDDEVSGVSIIDRDFTTHKETLALLSKQEREQRSLATVMAGILDSLPDMLFVFNSEDEIIKMSPDAEALLTHEGVSERINKLLRSKTKIVKETLDKYIPLDYTNVHEIRIGAETRFYLPRLTPIINHHGEYDGAVAMLQDVTEFKMLDEVKSGLLGTVSHELKTPITSVRMALWMTVDETIGPLNEKQASVLGTAKDEMERLLRTTNLLLDLTRFEEGFGDLKYVSTDPQELVRSVVASLNAPLSDKEIKIETNVQENLPAIRIDKDRIAQALDNIIRNAIKFTPDDARIQVNAKQVNDHIVFEVLDEGPGIPDEQKKKIFGKFYRLPEHAKRRGSGLGLCIVQQYINAHNGKVGVTDNTPKGSRFWIKIPLEPPKRIQD